MFPESSDVVVVGAGNAAMCAALAAREQGARVIVLERAPEDESGGNTRFTAGAIRFAYNGVEDLRELMPDLTEEESRAHRLRRLHGKPVLRRHGAGDGEPRRPGSGRVAGPAQQADDDVAARQGIALRADLRAAGVQGRRPLQVLGRIDGGSLGRRSRPGRSAQEGGGCKRHPHFLRRARDVAAAWRRRRARAQRALSGKVPNAALQGGRPCRGRLRIQSGMAHALSGPGLGSGQSARDAVQHRRRHPHGAGRRRGALRQLVRLPRGRLGSQRARVRRPRRRRRFPETFVSVRHHAQCQRRTLRRRGRRLPQLHICEIRRGHPAPAGAVRLADLRQEGDAPAARRIPHPPGHQGNGEHARRTGRKTRRRERAKGARNHLRAYNAAIRTDIAFDPNIKDGRRTEGLPVPKSNWANVLDTPPYEAYAVSCGITFTFGGLRITTDAQVVDTDGMADAGALCGGRTGRRPVLFQLSRRHRTDVGRGVRPHRRQQCRPRRHSV